MIILYIYYKSILANAVNIYVSYGDSGSHTPVKLENLVDVSGLVWKAWIYQKPPSNNSGKP